MYGLDGEELWYADFNKKEGVVALPPFADQISFPGYYEQAVGELEIMKGNLAKCIKAYKNPPEAIGKREK